MNRVNKAIGVLKDHSWVMAGMWELAVWCGDEGKSLDNYIRGWLEDGVTVLAPTPWSDEFLQKSGWSIHLVHNVDGEEVKIEWERKIVVVFQTNLPSRYKIEAEVFGVRVSCSWLDTELSARLAVAKVFVDYPDARILGVIAKETQNGLAFAERYFFAPCPPEQQTP